MTGDPFPHCNAPSLQCNSDDDDVSEQGCLSLGIRLSTSTVPDYVAKTGQAAVDGQLEISTSSEEKRKG